MGEKYFMVLCIISQNRYRINIIALIDIGVNGFAFINTAYTINIVKFLNIKAILFEKPV